MGRSRTGDGGQALPLAAAMLAVVVAALVALVPVGRALEDRARARTAADAAALAGAAEGEAAARQVAGQNGGRLLAFERAGTEVTVRVAVGDRAASARARAVAGPAPGTDAVGARDATGHGSEDQVP